MLAIVRSDWTTVDRLTDAERVPADFADTSLRCDVHPQLHAKMETEGRLEQLGDAAEPLTAMRAKVRADNLLLIARAEQAAAALEAAEIPALALKGLDLIHRVYRFDERPLDDIDLLVPFDRLRDAMAALESIGFRTPAEPARTHYIRSSHHLPLDAPGPLPVGFELHWDLAQQGRFSVDPDGLLERAHPLSLGQQTMLRCDDHDFVAHLLLHHLSHYFDTRLKWLIDLQRITTSPEFNWERALDRIRAWGATVACSASLIHLHKLDPVCVPATLLEALPLPWSRRPFLAPFRSNHPLELLRGTRRRKMQLYLAAVLLENWAQLPGWMLHRSRRDSEISDNPLDDGGETR